VGIDPGDRSKRGTERVTETGAGPGAIRDRWGVGTVTLGGWCAIANSFSAELMGRSGFDWVCIDQQHGLAGPDALVPMIQALGLSATPAFVRVPWNEPASIMRALDAGAQGVIVPLVNTGAEAAAAVAAARYAPLGERSWGPARPLQEIPGYTPALGNRRVIVAVQIETVEAIRNLDQILDVTGVDAVFVGPSDLALTAGWEPTLSPKRDEHRQLILDVLAAAHRRSVVAGIYSGGLEMSRVWLEVGFDMIAVSSDTLLLKGAAVEILRALRSPDRGTEPSSPLTY
jgi:4-hydroxy-2-oxoheptanedioate aldolase